MPGAGADLIEIGMPFTDPMADGPTIQAAGQRGAAAGATLARTLAMVREFRREDDDDAGHPDGLPQPDRCPTAANGSARTPPRPAWTG